MKALVYHGPGAKAWEDVANPRLAADSDAIVRVDTTTICGTDLHILRGDVPAMTDGRIIGHEAVGTVQEVGAGQALEQFPGEMGRTAIARRGEGEAVGPDRRSSRRSH